MPLFSIITINLNNSAGLKKTIESVSSQSFRDFEHIVIDGDSSDGSKEVIENNQSKLSYWISEKDQGIYNAMNKGIAQAKGEYCLFLNSGDSLFDKQVLQKIAHANLTEDLVSGNILFKTANGKLVENRMPDTMTKYFFLQNTLYHPITFIKRKSFKKFGDYDEQYKIGGDFEFFLRMFSQGKITYKHVDATICIFDSTGISSMPEFRKLLETERWLALKRYFNPLIYFPFRLYRFQVNVIKKIIGRS